MSIIINIVNTPLAGDRIILDNGAATEQFQALLEEIEQFSSVEDWHIVGNANEPAFQNSWDNIGGGDAVAAFYKDSFGRVYIKGHVDTGASGTAVFTLPQDYRPSEIVEFTCHTTSGGGGSGGHSYAVITTDGDVTLTMSGTSIDVSMDNISFRVDT